MLGERRPDGPHCEAPFCKAVLVAGPTPSPPLPYAHLHHHHRNTNHTNSTKYGSFSAEIGEGSAPPPIPPPCDVCGRDGVGRREWEDGFPMHCAAPRAHPQGCRCPGDWGVLYSVLFICDAAPSGNAIAGQLRDVPARTPPHRRVHPNGSAHMIRRTSHGPRGHTVAHALAAHHKVQTSRRCPSGDPGCTPPPPMGFALVMSVPFLVAVATKPDDKFHEGHRFPSKWWTPMSSKNHTPCGRGVWW